MYSSRDGTFAKQDFTMLTDAFETEPVCLMVLRTACAMTATSAQMSDVHTSNVPVSMMPSVSYALPKT